MWLLLQMLVVALPEIADDLWRGNVVQPGAALAEEHARWAASFEATHGFFIEPGLQRLIVNTHGPAGVLWGVTVPLLEGVYAVFHLLAFFVLLVWLHMAHRRAFNWVRAVAFLTSVMSVAIYELFPMAPPRLMTGFLWHGHGVRFHDLMSPIIGGGSLHGTGVGYNQYSAMPSLHIAWAIIVGASLLLLGRRPLLRLMGLLYPALMLLTVVITGSHFLLDAAGSVFAVLSSVLLTAACFSTVVLVRVWHQEDRGEERGNRQAA